jgi:hypothetical protein
VQKAKFLPMLAIAAAVLIAGSRHGYILFTISVTSCFVFGIIACVAIDPIRGQDVEPKGFDVVVKGAHAEDDEI